MIGASDLLGHLEQCHRRMPESRNEPWCEDFRDVTLDHCGVVLLEIVPPHSTLAEQHDGLGKPLFSKILDLSVDKERDWRVLVPCTVSACATSSMMRTRSSAGRARRKGINFCFARARCQWKWTRFDGRKRELTVSILFGMLRTMTVVQTSTPSRMLRRLMALAASSALRPPRRGVNAVVLWRGRGTTRDIRAVF